MAFDPISFGRIQQAGIAQLSTVRTLSFCDRYDDDAGATFTWGSVWAIPGEFDFVRLFYKNKGTAPFDVTKAVVAAPYSINESGGFAPLDASGTAITWTPATHAGGAAAITVPAALSGGGNQALAVPGIAGSDLIALPSRLRADGKMSYLQARLQRTAGKALRAATLNTIWQDPAVNLGREVRAFIKTGDYTSIAVVPTPTINGWLEPAMVQAYTRQRGGTWGAYQDSLGQGAGTTGELMGWVHRACAMVNSPALPMSLVMSAYSGSTSDAIYARAQQEIELLRPEVASYPVFTPNDGQTTLTDAIIEQGWQRAMLIVDYCYRRNVRPVLVGTMPWKYTAANDAFRMKIEARLQAMAANGSILACIFNPVLTDGATPARLKAEYLSATTGTDPHPNDAGHQACAMVAAPIIQRALSR